VPIFPSPSTQSAQRKILGRTLIDDDYCVEFGHLKYLNLYAINDNINDPSVD